MGKKISRETLHKLIKEEVELVREFEMIKTAAQDFGKKAMEAVDFIVAQTLIVLEDGGFYGPMARMLSDVLREKLAPDPSSPLTAGSRSIRRIIGMKKIFMDTNHPMWSEMVNAVKAAEPEVEAEIEALKAERPGKSAEEILQSEGPVVFSMLNSLGDTIAAIADKHAKMEMSRQKIAGDKVLRKAAGVFGLDETPVKMTADDLRSIINEEIDSLKS